MQNTHENAGAAPNERSAIHEEPHKTCAKNEMRNTHCVESGKLVGILAGDAEDAVGDGAASTRFTLKKHKKQEEKCTKGAENEQTHETREQLTKWFWKQNLKARNTRTKHTRKARNAENRPKCPAETKRTKRAKRANRTKSAGKAHETHEQRM